jgi:hypothetical protein
LVSSVTFSSSSRSFIAPSKVRETVRVEDGPVRIDRPIRRAEPARPLRALGDGGLEGHAGLDVDGVDRALQGGHHLAGVIGGDAGAQHGAFQGLAGTHLDGDGFRTLEAGLGLGAGEGGVLQGGQGAGVQRRLDHLHRRVGAVSFQPRPRAARPAIAVKTFGARRKVGRLGSNSCIKPPTGSDADAAFKMTRLGCPPANLAPENGG